KSCRCRRWWWAPAAPSTRPPPPPPRGRRSSTVAPPRGQVPQVPLSLRGSPEGSHTTAEVAAAQEGGKPSPTGESARTSVAVDSTYTASVFFNPRTKYIWALALDRQGQLYVGTGDRGEIFRVDRDGNGALFFQSDEAQIRALDFDNSGNLIAGTDGSGLIYRITPQGEAFVLYSAPKKEITALAVDGHGDIYAAGAGEKRSATPPLAPPSSVPL